MGSPQTGTVVTDPRDVSVVVSAQLHLIPLTFWFIDLPQSSNIPWDQFLARHDRHAGGSSNNTQPAAHATASATDLIQPDLTFGRLNTHGQWDDTEETYYAPPPYSRT
jgi:hypothetical protein